MMDRGQWANLARMPELNPLFFQKDMGFLMTTENQDLGFGLNLYRKHKLHLLPKNI